MITRLELSYIGIQDLEERLLSNTERHGDCMFWGGAKTKDGYGMLMLTKVSRGIRRIIKAHQLSWLLHKGDIPSGLCVCHKCDNPSCVNPDHLFLDTHAGNMRDMKEKGRARNGMKKLVGSKHPGAVLDEVIVRCAREAIKMRGGLRRLSRATGFKYATLWKAAHKPWGELR